MSAKNRAVYSALFALLILTGGASLFAADPPMPVPSDKLIKIEEKLTKIEQGQAAILLKLDEVLKELNVVKIRARRT